MYREFSAETPSPGKVEPNGPPAWQADLQLGFVNKGGKTVLATRGQRGPLTVQRPFYPEGGLSHVYILHPPGGVVGGDRLRIDADCGPGAQALLTTPAAGKFYRSGGDAARQIVNLRLAGQATLEWLPQETIVYQGAKIHSEMNIDLTPQSAFIGWEILAMGRPAAGEGFESGEAVFHCRIGLDGKPLYRERLCLDAKAFQARWGLNGKSACGTLFAYPAGKDQLAAVQALIADHPGRGASKVDGMLICRALDERADILRDFFQQVWALTRLPIINRPACLPRIWAT